MRYLYSLILLTFSYTIYGQVSVVNRSLSDSLLNYLYIGVENAIEVSGVQEKYTMTITGGGATITRAGNNRFVVKAAFATTLCEVQLVKNNKAIFKKRYEVLPISTIVATIMGFRDTVIRISLLLANPFVAVTLPGCYWRHGFRVIDFQTVFVQNGDSTVMEGSGNSLSPKQIQVVKTLKPGDKINFDEIRAVGRDGRTQRLPSFWLKIE